MEHDDLPTGVIFGFFEQLRTTCFDPRICSNRVALFFDSRQSHRRRLWGEYKRKRQEHKTPEELQQIAIMHQQGTLLREEVLPAIGFPIYRQTGLESDDLIASVCQDLDSLWKEDKQAVIISSDGDLYQCITRRIHWFDPGRDLYLDDRKLWVKKGIEPHRWAEVKMIAGCSSDNVPGVPGVGEKTAISFLNGVLPHRYKSYQAIVGDKGRKIIRRNRYLVLLPHEKTKPIKLQEPHYHPSVFKRYCNQYGMDSYLEGRMKSEWANFFAGQMERGQQIPRRRGEKK